MLAFGGIWDTEVVRWYVIDANDFPQIWHAWVRIWSDFYDPTFDDPVKIKKTKTPEEYKYFKLPQDLFYTNRFIYKNTPEYLKTKSLEYRKNFTKTRIFDLFTNKYKNSNYLITKPFQFRKKYWLQYNEKITTSNLNKILPLYEVKDFSFSHPNSWETKAIKKLKYFVIDNNTLENIIEQVKYDLEWYYFFKWQLPNSRYEYRLAYGVEFR